MTKTPSTSRGSGARTMKQRVRTARGRTVSSTKWLERQLNDPFVHAARAAGYRSRAAFKLAELDDRYRLLKPGSIVLDLGAAPGGWTQVAVERLKLAPGVGGSGGGRVVSIDILDMDPVPGAEVLKLDFTDDDAPGRLATLIGPGGVDVVLSDMAASATGHRPTDHLRIVALCDMAVDFARRVLRPGGSFVAKVLQGGTEGGLLADMKRDFAEVRHAKPKASRQDSAELYVVATGFRGARDDDQQAGPTGDTEGNAA